MALNTCKRQKLPVIQGQTGMLFVNPKGKPFPLHRHSQVANHWKRARHTHPTKALLLEC